MDVGDFLIVFLRCVSSNRLLVSFFSGRPAREGETSVQHQRRMHGAHRGLPAGEVVRRERRRQQVRFRLDCEVKASLMTEKLLSFLIAKLPRRVLQGHHH